ncbi:MAG: hypothetical protein HYY31_04660 [Chloroflexi bacterium]|nr:hypothetical protein [Chloroflexota bacterium]
MRIKVLGILVIGILAATGVFSASMTGSTKMLGGGSDNVAHCQVLDSTIPASDTISSVDANVKCDLTGSYNVTATVTSGASSGSGQGAASLTANVAQVVAVSISPSVTIGSSTYTADVLVQR